jgi:peptidoglycan lytic transglycosylase
MKHPQLVLAVYRFAGAALALLLPGCALPIGQGETLPLAAAAPQAKEERTNAEGPKVEQVGNASWYGAAQDGKETASGETFDQKKLTAAHPTLPLGSKAVVTNLKTGKSVQVTINDRGPYVKGRKIDLSKAAAQQIGMSKSGVAKVKIEGKRRRKSTDKLAKPKTEKRGIADETHADTVPAAQ